MPIRARILATATALPAHRVAQAEARQAALGLFGQEPHLRRALRVFATSGVATRYFVRPAEECVRPAPLRARNQTFIEEAIALSQRALVGALAGAHLEADQLDHLVLATTTGVATPSIDAHLAHRMGLRPDLERTPLFGIGCAAGGVGLARASDLARARPGARIALVTVEICSLTFQPGDLSAKNVVGCALFGDGAAAAILEAAPGAHPHPSPGPRVAAHQSHLFPDSLGVMGFTLTESGLELVLSRELPELVARDAPQLVTGFLDRHGLKVGDIEVFLVHPGGPKVIDATETALGLARGTLDNTRRFLRAHGNLSSASVLFLLDEVMRAPPPRAGTMGLLLAFGPGFSAELVLLAW